MLTRLCDLVSKDRVADERGTLRERGSGERGEHILCARAMFNESTYHLSHFYSYARPLHAAKTMGAAHISHILCGARRRLRIWCALRAVGDVLRMAIIALREIEGQARGKRERGEKPTNIEREGVIEAHHAE